jgi:hypothetical protein
MGVPAAVVPVDTEAVDDLDLDRRPIGLATALAAVVASSLLRAPWFVLLLMMPSTVTGITLFCLVLVSAGVLLLHWCLQWFGWTLPFRAALAARALPAIVAVSTTGALGLRASLPVLLAMGGLEFLLAVGVVAAQATRLDAGHGLTGFEAGELLPADPEQALPPEERYGRDVASLVREARAARLRPSSRTSY